MGEDVDTRAITQTHKEDAVAEAKRGHRYTRHRYMNLIKQNHGLHTEQVHTPNTGRTKDTEASGKQNGHREDTERTPIYDLAQGKHHNDALDTGTSDRYVKVRKCQPSLLIMRAGFFGRGTPKTS